MFSRGMPDFVRGSRICARVVSIAGPWRRQGEWWKTALDFDHANGDDASLSGGFAHDYYEMALDDGGVYRVFRDLPTERWFVDGIYD